MTQLSDSVFSSNGTRGRLQQKDCLFILTWWEKYEKRNIRLLFIKEGTEKNRKDRINENVCYACIYGILEDLDFKEIIHPY